MISLSPLVGALLIVLAVILLGLLDGVLHPAVAICLSWGIILSAAGIAEHFGYFRISPNALFIFLVGVLSFVAGALSFSFVPAESGFPRRFGRFHFTRIAGCCFIIHLVMIPLAYLEAMQISSGTDDFYAAAYLLRASAVAGDDRVGPLVGNYLLSGLFFIPLLFVGWRQREVPGGVLALLSLPWIVLNLFISGRSSMFVLALSLTYIHFSLGGKLSLRSVCSFIVLVGVISIAGNLLVGKIEATAEDDLLTIAGQSAKGFVDYAVQGTILFSEYLEYKYKIVSTWDVFIFPCHILSKFDLCQVPPLHQEYLRFSVFNDGYGNVYTLFFSIFPKYGWPGLVLISVLLGLWAGFQHAYRHASFFSLLLSSLLFSAVVLSVYSEQFGSNVYLFVKLLLMSMVASLVFKKT